MKKKLLIILSIVFILWLLLFVIQIIDNKINGEDYQKIHAFGQQFKDLMLENNECSTDLEQVITKLFEDDANNTDKDISINALKTRASACFERAKQFNDIPIPEVKDLQKKEMMYNAKEDFVYNIENWGNILIVFVEAKQNNQAIDTQQLLNLINTTTKIQKKLFITALEFYMTYSVRDIIITRPFLLYSKLRLH